MIRLNQVNVIFCSLAILICSSRISKAQQTVKISGISEDMKENSISVRKLPAFNDGQRIAYLAQQTSNIGDFNFSFMLEKPEMLIFSAYSRNWFINFNPGDSISFKITDKGIDQKLSYSGKGEVRYNFDVLVSDAFEKAQRFRLDSTLIKYKATLDEWKSTTEEKIKSYAADYSIDKESTGIAIDRLNFTYVRLIYYTASTRKQEVIPGSYFFEADKYQFNNDKFLSFREYRNAIYSKYITSKATNSKDDLEKSYNLIETKLKGKTRDHALVYLAGQYAVKQSAADSQMLRKIFNSLYAKKLDSNSVQYLKNRERKYYKIDKPLPESILNNTILVNYSDSKQINLKQLLDAYKGKAVYIDLWASWCGGCRADIAESSEVKKMLIESGVSYLYISSDKDKEAWKKASVQDQITTDQYKFEYGKYKEFNDFIELFSIPRYIILDKNHHVKNLFAPSPTSSYAGELRQIIQELSANSK